MYSRFHTFLYFPDIVVYKILLATAGVIWILHFLISPCRDVLLGLQFCLLQFLEWKKQEKSIFSLSVIGQIRGFLSLSAHSKSLTVGNFSLKTELHILFLGKILGICLQQIHLLLHWHKNYYFIANLFLFNVIFFLSFEIFGNA